MDELDQLYGATDSARWADAMRDLEADHGFQADRQEWLNRVAACHGCTAVDVLEPAE